MSDDSRVIVLGLRFRPMDDRDFEAFAGADRGCFIAETEGAVLIWDPTTEVLSEIHEDGDQRDWSYREV
jgi:hypothetical protein